MATLLKLTVIVNLQCAVWRFFQMDMWHRDQINLTLMHYYSFNLRLTYKSIKNIKRHVISTKCEFDMEIWLFWFGSHFYSRDKNVATNVLTLLL